MSYPRPVEEALGEIERVQTIQALRQIESQGAAAYWQALAGLPVHFAPPSYAKRVPGHWTVFPGRGSPLSRGPRHAVDPVNALLSYAYALAEAEAVLACHEAGLDPFLSLLHTDQDGRRSLLYDLIEPVRPLADRLVV